MINITNSLNLYKTKNYLLEHLDSINTNQLVYDLCDFGSKYALNGNIWQKYITYFIAHNENPFSLDCEYKKCQKGSIYELAKFDLDIIAQIYTCDIQKELGLKENVSKQLCNFSCPKQQSYNQIITDDINILSKDIDNAISAHQPLVDIVANYYKSHGVGDIGMHKAFKIIRTDELMVKTSDNLACILPITKTDTRQLGDIIGYDLQKQQVCDNTQAFLQGKQANNVLLYGDGGTGKSSTIKAILNEYFDKGLRIIEVYKHQFSYISDIISQIKNRNCKFIIYLDDLSFEDFEIEYKYFKAIIDGGMEVKPENVLIYATSNRRHLIKETTSDKNDIQFDGELHKSDTVQEKLSLASRFGLSLFYGSPTQMQYLDIVRELSKKYNIDIDESTLERKAMAWSMRNNGKSGRTAQQFINSLL